MNRLAPLPDPVRWSEGMLLSPQHFQQEHRYWHARLARQLSCAAPHLWGVDLLELDRAALVGGTVALKALECLMPDGSLVQYPAAGDAPLAVVVGDLCQAGGAPVRICLTVPEQRRFDDTEATTDLDDNGEGEPVAVERMRLRCSLAAYASGQHPPPGLTVCPLLEIERDAAGVLRLSDYHPPLLRLSAAGFLGERGIGALTGALVERIWQKIDELGGAWNEALGADELAGRGQLHAARALAAGLPLLDLSVNENGLHPRELYRALALLAGQAVALGGHPLPLKLPPYLHEDCLPQFAAVCRHLHARLDALHADYERYPFAPFKDGYARRLFDDMHGDVVIEIKPQAGQSAAQSAAWLESASIASVDMLPAVQIQRQGGAVARRLSPSEAHHLGLPAGAQLFVLKNTRILSQGAYAYRGGDQLIIQGGPPEKLPAAVFLYRRLAGAAPVALDEETDGVTACGDDHV